MITSTEVLPLNHWQIVFHQTMAALLRAQEAVKRQFGFWGLLNGLWTCSRDLKALNGSLKEISELPDGTVSEEFFRSQMPQVKKLLSSIEELIDVSKRNQLTNRSLTSAVLGSIRLQGEYIADYLESIEMSFDPEVLKAIKDGQDQIDRGEFESMEHLH